MKTRLASITYGWPMDERGEGARGAMPEQAKSLALTIDGKTLAVPEGTTVLQACEREGGG